MKIKTRQSAFTLIEMLLVVSIMVLFSALAIPAFNNITQSNKTGQALSLIKSYMALAQAHAAQTQKYAGIRFQLDLEGNQHLILIEKNDLTLTGPGTPFSPNSYRLTYRFTSVSNSKTSKLPANVRAVHTGYIPDIDADNALDQNELDTYEWNNFSIIFSPTGQLVQKQCVCLPRVATGQTSILLSTYTSAPPQYDDRIFAFRIWGTLSEKGAPFESDNVIFPEWWVSSLSFPNSQSGFIVYDANIMKNTPDNQRINYLTSTLIPSIVNTFTGSVLQLDDIR